MEDDAAVREADLMFEGDGAPSSDDEPSDDDQGLGGGQSAEEESEDEGVEEEEDSLLLGEGSRALKRPREEFSGDEDEEGANNELLDIHPRKRGMDYLTRDYTSLDEDDEDDSDDSDEDYSPSSWFCVNCTCKTGDEYTFCAVCGEHRRSGILQRGFVASPDIPGDAGVAEDGPLYVPQPVQLSEEDWSRATAIGTDDKMLLHFDEGKDGGSPHPERPDRLRAIIAGLVHSGLFPGRCVPFKSREADRAEIESVHTSHHVDDVEMTVEESRYFTSDTYTNTNSCQAARLAAGISADMAAAIAADKLRNGVAVVRPPGHHAMSETIMGFCLHNNAAVAAKAAQAAGAKKILIVDWDVHHGNGTQEIFEHDPSVLYISLHRYDRGAFYPGTGRIYDDGTGAGAGFSVNIPWPCANIGDSDYITAFTRIILPLAYQFCPSMVIVSAGFDAAAGDPLGGCLVSPAGYAHMTSLLKPLAQGRMLIVLEGGYNLRSISSSLAACVKVLLGDAPPPLPSSLQPSEEGLATIAEVSAVQARHWTVLGHQEIQVHPIISGEDEEEFDSLGDARADHLTSNGNRLGDAGEDAGGHPKYWLPAPAVPALPAPPPPPVSSVPLPSYPPGATSPHTFTRIPSPRHPSLEPLPAEPKPVPAFAPPAPPRSQPQANSPPHIPAMPPPSYVASPVHQPFHYPSPAHPSTYLHPSPAHPSTYHHPSPAHPSAYHHPSPAHPSTSYHPSPAHPSTYHHPSPAHPSTYHHPSPSRAAMLTSPQHPSQTPSHGALSAYHPSPAYTNHPQSIFHPPSASPQHHSVPYVMSTVHLKASAPTAPPTVAPLIPRPMNAQQKRPDVVRSPSVQPQPIKKSASALNLSHVSSPLRVQTPAPNAQSTPCLPEASPAVESVAVSAQPAVAVSEQLKP